MRTSAVVDSVEVVTAGSFTVGAAAAAVTVLPIGDMADFSEGGGICYVDGVVVAGVLSGGRQVSYSAAVSDDVNGDYLSVAAPGLPAAVGDRAAVYVVPLVQRKVAYVRLAVDPDGIAAEAQVVDPALWADTRLAETATGGQSVTVQSGRGGLFTVVSIDGSAPVLDGQVLDPAMPITPGAIVESYRRHKGAHSNTVPADALGAGDITADVRLAGSVTSGDPGTGAVVHNRHGSVSLSQGGAVRSSQSTDSAQEDMHRGDAEIRNLTVTGSAAFVAPVDVRRGGSIRLKAETVTAAPSVAPTATPSYYAVPIAFPAGSVPGNRRGVALNGLSAGFTVELAEAGSESGVFLSTPPTLHVFDPVTGAYIGGWPMLGPPASGEVVGVVYVGTSGKLNTLEFVASTVGGNAQWQTRFWSFDGSTLTYLSQQPWVLGGAARFPTPAFASVSPGRQFITRADAQTGVVTFWEYGVGMTSPVSTTVTNLVLEPDRRDLAGASNVAYSMMIVSAATGGVIEDVDATTGLWQATYPAPMGEASAAGYTRGGGSSYTAASRQLSATNNMLYSFSPFHEPDMWWAGYAFRNSATGTETAVSPLAPVTRVRGSSLIFSAGELPPGADSVSWYAAASPTAPARTALWKQNSGQVFGPTDPRAGIIVLLRNDNSDGLHPNPLAVGTLPYFGAVPYLQTTDGSIPIDATYTGMSIAVRLAALEAGGGGGGGGSGGGVSRNDLIYGGNAYESGWGLITGGAASTAGTADTIFGGKAV